MFCEVLGLKEVSVGRFAVVRLVDSPDVIGEVPVSKGSVVNRGDVVELHIKPRVYQGRLAFSVMVA